MGDESKITTYSKKVYAKENMPVSDILKNGNDVRKKIAHIFDNNDDGIYDAGEARLFNATSATLKQDGSISLWINHKNGKKTSINIPKEDLPKTRLYLCNNNRMVGTYLEEEYYGDNLEPDGKYELTIGESADPNGHVVIKDNIEKYYTEKGKLSGSIERKNGKEYFKAPNGKVLYSIKHNRGGYSDDNLDYYDNNGVLRYSVRNKSDIHVSVTKYNEKAEEVGYYEGNIFCEPCYDPHTEFLPLDDVFLSTYCIPDLLED